MSIKVNTRHVALVGRPNVGKSRLFNRLLGKRVAIVHDQPGVTRDILAETIGENDFILMDTGGIGMLPSKMSSLQINEATEEQVSFAIQAADLILFVVDAVDGLTAQDHEIANKLRASGRKTLAVINKIDTKVGQENESIFHELGFEALSISAEHGLQIESLLEKIKETLGPKSPEEALVKSEELEHVTRLCFVGRPNVGKSSLTNCLLNEKRMIVSDVPGTTRDAIKVNFSYKGKNFQLVDTAGLRQKTKVDNSVEFFSSLRSKDAIERCDVVFLVIDAMEGFTKQDKLIAGEVIESGRGLVVIVNKWDYVLEIFKEEPLEGYEDIREYKKAFKQSIEKAIFFHRKAPILFASAKENFEVKKIFEEAHQVHERMKRSLSTSKLNKTIGELLKRQKPKIVHGKLFKIYYGVQVGNFPFRIRMYCNTELSLEESYVRYLKNGILEAFHLVGCPLKIEFIGKRLRKN